MDVAALDDVRAEVVGALLKRSVDRGVGGCVELLLSAADVVARLAVHVEERAGGRHGDRTRRQSDARSRRRVLDSKTTEERGRAALAVLLEGRVEAQQLTADGIER